MTKAPISLQELRRRIYRKAKSDKTHRFWGIFVHITKPETQRSPPRALAERTVPAIGRHCGPSGRTTWLPRRPAAGLDKSVHNFLGAGVAHKSELRPGKPDQPVFQVCGEQRVSRPACGIQRAGATHRAWIVHRYSN